MGQAIKKKTIPGNDDERDIMLIGKIYKSFEALEETLGKLQLEEPLFITYMACLLYTSPSPRDCS